MIYEYAIEPELLKKWAGSERDYREFLREYGVGTPRLVSSFPKMRMNKWRSYYLRQAPAEEDSTQARRYLDMVEYLSESLILRDGFECQTEDWRREALTEDGRAPFHVLLADRPMQSSRCLTTDTMYAENSLWDNARQKNVSRTCENITSCLRNMVRLASDKIVFVDPYLFKKQALKAVVGLICTALSDRVCSQQPELVLFYKSTPSSSSAEHVRSEIVRQLGDDIQALSAVSIYQLEELPGGDVFHNRCILTEHGGVSLGHGMTVSEDPHHTDEMTLLEREIYEKKWRQFVGDLQGNNLCFKLIDKA